MVAYFFTRCIFLSYYEKTVNFSITYLLINYEAIMEQLTAKALVYKHNW